MYTKKYTIRMHDSDAAGVIFFANQFRIVHEVYEEWLDKHDLGFGQMLDTGKIFIPIVHAESDFLKPLMVGDSIKITLSVDHIGTSSFTIRYTIEKLHLLKKILAGTAKTIHTTMNIHTEKTIPIPRHIRKILEKHVIKQKPIPK